MDLKQKLGMGIVGLGLLAFGCDDYDMPKGKLAEREYTGKVKIELSKQRIPGRDDYILDVKDSTGTVIATMKGDDLDENETYLYLQNGEKYTSNGVLIEDKKD